MASGTDIDPFFKPLSHIDACKVNMYFRSLTIQFVWSTNIQFPQGTRYFAYINEDLIDRDSKPYKTYTVTKEQFLTAYNFMIIPVPASATDPHYDPLGSIGLVNQFTNVYRDVVFPSDQFVCPRRETTYEHFTKVRKNYVDPAWKVQVFNVRPGSLVRLRERKRVVGTEMLTKPVGPTRPILVVKDYRYDGQFDQQQYQQNPRHKPACRPYPANAGYVMITTDSGTYSMSELELVKF